MKKTCDYLYVGGMRIHVENILITRIGPDGLPMGGPMYIRPKGGKKSGKASSQNPAKDAPIPVTIKELLAEMKKNNKITYTAALANEERRIMPKQFGNIPFDPSSATGGKGRKRAVKAQTKEETDAWGCYDHVLGAPKIVLRGVSYGSSKKLGAVNARAGRWLLQSKVGSEVCADILASTSAEDKDSQLLLARSFADVETYLDHSLTPSERIQLDTFGEENSFIVDKASVLSFLGRPRRADESTGNPDDHGPESESEKMRANFKKTKMYAACVNYEEEVAHDTHDDPALAALNAKIDEYNERVLMLSDEEADDEDVEFFLEEEADDDDDEDDEYYEKQDRIEWEHGPQGPEHIGGAYDHNNELRAAVELSEEAELQFWEPVLEVQRELRDELERDPTPDEVTARLRLKKSQVPEVEVMDFGAEFGKVKFADADGPSTEWNYRSSATDTNPSDSAKEQEPNHRQAAKHLTRRELEALGAEIDRERTLIEGKHQSLVDGAAAVTEIVEKQALAFEINEMRLTEDKNKAVLSAASEDAKRDIEEKFARDQARRVRELDESVEGAISARRQADGQANDLADFDYVQAGELASYEKEFLEEHGLSIGDYMSARKEKDGVVLSTQVLGAYITLSQKHGQDRDTFVKKQEEESAQFTSTQSETQAPGQQSATEGSDESASSAEDVPAPKARPKAPPRATPTEDAGQSDADVKAAADAKAEADAKAYDEAKGKEVLETNSLKHPGATSKANQTRPSLVLEDQQEYDKFVAVHGEFKFADADNPIAESFRSNTGEETASKGERRGNLVASIETWKKYDAAAAARKEREEIVPEVKVPQNEPETPAEARENSPHKYLRENIKRARAEDERTKQDKRKEEDKFMIEFGVKNRAEARANEIRELQKSLNAEIAVLNGNFINAHYSGDSGGNAMRKADEKQMKDKVALAVRTFEKEKKSMNDKHDALESAELEREARGDLPYQKIREGTRAWVDAHDKKEEIEQDKEWREYELKQDKIKLDKNIQDDIDRKKSKEAQAHDPEVIDFGDDFGVVKFADADGDDFGVVKFADADGPIAESARASKIPKDERVSIVEDRNVGYKIGDVGPGGGIIFYIKSGTYLEAAPRDIGKFTWENALSKAAKYTTTVNGTMYNDWYLPSKGQLNDMYANRTLIGGFSTDLYWSSSEYAANTAWSQSFTIGNQFSSNKDGAGYVHPVRAFSI